MKKIFSIIVLLTITFNSFAATGSIQALERHLDNYQYSMTVEWDQKDSAQQDALLHRFLTEAEKELVDISPADLEAVLAKRLDAKTFEALKLELALNPIQSSAELATFLKERSHLFYQQGASWNGRATLVVAGVIAGITAFVFAIIWASGKEPKCVRKTTQYYCYERYDWDNRTNGPGALEKMDCRDHEICAEYEVLESR